MRWTLTSPDGLGDFLLRLPWIKEMERHGWQLQLVGRSHALEAARIAGIRADLIPIRRNPYDRKTYLHPHPFREEIQSIRNFSADIVFFGPSNPTFFEDQLAEHGDRMTTAGFFQKGRWLTQSIRNPVEISKKHKYIVEVDECESDINRNKKAAECILGKKIIFNPCQLEPIGRFDASQLFSVDRFLTINTSSREGEPFRDFGESNWIRELRSLSKKTGLPMLFTGTENEIASHRRIVNQLKTDAMCVDLTGKIRTLNELALVITESEGYVGKDCGTLHLAAALGKPVVAVFGGGTSPRFFPWGTKAVSLTMDVPCAGCDWRCHLPRRVCMEDLPPGSITEAWKTVKSLEKEEGILVKYQMGPEQVTLLKKNPAKDFPFRIHEERKSSLAKARKLSLSLGGRVKGLISLIIQKIR